MEETVHEVEEWRPVAGKHESLRCEVSNAGRVRNEKGIILYQGIDSTGYFRVSLGRCTRDRTHVLVAEAFIGPRPDGLCVNHKDGNKLNNRPSNLEYITQADNCRHASISGLVKYAVGEKIAAAVLTDELVRQIRNDYELGVGTTRALAKKYGIGKSTIHAVTSRTTWDHVS